MLNSHVVELRARLTAELIAMEPQARAANCDVTVDDSIADSLVTGFYRRVEDDV